MDLGRGVILLIGAINTRKVKVFGEMEFWLTIVKVGAIIAMIVGGLALMVMGTSFESGQPVVLGSDRERRPVLRQALLRDAGVAAERRHHRR